MIKVLHKFNRYLPTSQNWAYRLLTCIPDVDIHIHAEEYLPLNYYPQQWNFWEVYHREVNGYYSELKKANPYEFLLKAVMKTTFLRDIKRKKRQKLLESIQQEKISVAHSHFGTIAVKYHRYFMEASIPHVISFYGFDYEFAPYNNPAIMIAYKKLFKEAAAFICEGRHGARILEKYGCPGDKIHVVKLGLDAKQILSSPKTKEKGTLRLIQIANFTEKKGHIYTVSAFAKALATCPNMHLTLVGNLKHESERWILDEIKGLINTYQMNEKVDLINAIDFSRLYEYLCNFDVFIHPSCYAQNMDCEGGAPVVILDAQSVGLPVISTRHCDIPDEVLDGKTGLLTNEKDVDAIADAIRSFYGMDVSEYRMFSAAAINHVKKEFNVLQGGRKLGEIYRRLLSEA